MSKKGSDTIQSMMGRILGVIGTEVDPGEIFASSSDNLPVLDEESASRPPSGIELGRLRTEEEALEQRLRSIRAELVARAPRPEGAPEEEEEPLEALCQVASAVIEEARNRGESSGTNIDMSVGAAVLTPTLAAAALRVRQERDDIEKARLRQRKELRSIRRGSREEFRRLKKEHEAQIGEVQEAHGKDLEEQRKQHGVELKKIHGRHTQENKERAAQFTDLAGKVDQQVQELRQQLEGARTKANEEAEVSQKLRRQLSDEKDRRKAEAKLLEDALEQWHEAENKARQQENHLEEVRGTASADRQLCQQLEAELEQLERELDAQNARRRAREIELNERLASMTTQQESIDERQTELDQNEAQLSEKLRSREEQLQAQAEERDRVAREKQQELDSGLERVRHREEILTAERRALADLDERKSMVRALEREVEQREAAQQEARGELEEFRIRITQQQEEAAKSQAAMQRRGEELDELGLRQAEHHKELSDLRSKLERRNDKLAAREEKLSGRADELRSRRESIDDQQRQLNERSGRIDTVERGLEERLELLNQQHSTLRDASLDYERKESALRERQEKLSEREEQLRERRQMLKSRERRISEREQLLETQLLELQSTMEARRQDAKNRVTDEDLEEKRLALEATSLQIQELREELLKREEGLAEGRQRVELQAVEHEGRLQQLKDVEERLTLRAGKVLEQLQELTTLPAGALEEATSLQEKDELIGQSLAALQEQHGDLQQRKDHLADLEQRIRGERAGIKEQQDKLDARELELEQRSIEFQDRQGRMRRRREKLDERKGIIRERQEELKRRDSELETRRAALDGRQARLEKQQRALAARTESLEARTRGQDEVELDQSKSEATRQALAAQQAAVEARERALLTREGELREAQQALEQQREDFDHQLQTSSKTVLLIEDDPEEEAGPELEIVDGLELERELASDGSPTPERLMKQLDGLRERARSLQQREGEFLRQRRSWAELLRDQQEGHSVEKALQLLDDERILVDDVKNELAAERAALRERQRTTNERDTMLQRRASRLAEWEQKIGSLDSETNLHEQERRGADRRISLLEAELEALRGELTDQQKLLERRTAESDALREAMSARFKELSRLRSGQGLSPDSTAELIEAVGMSEVEEDDEPTLDDIPVLEDSIASERSDAGSNIEVDHRASAPFATPEPSAQRSRSETARGTAARAPKMRGDLQGIFRRKR